MDLEWDRAFASVAPDEAVMAQLRFFVVRELGAARRSLAAASNEVEAAGLRGEISVLDGLWQMCDGNDGALQGYVLAVVEGGPLDEVDRAAVEALRADLASQRQAAAAEAARAKR